MICTFGWVSLLPIVAIAAAVGWQVTRLRRRESAARAELVTLRADVLQMRGEADEWPDDEDNDAARLDDWQIQYLAEAHHAARVAGNRDAADRIEGVLEAVTPAWREYA